MVLLSLKLTIVQGRDLNGEYLDDLQAQTRIRYIMTTAMTRVCQGSTSPVPLKLNHWTKTKAVALAQFIIVPSGLLTSVRPSREGMNLASLPAPTFNSS